jgi:Mg-chelatase subunit ChlD
MAAKKKVSTKKTATKTKAAPKSVRKKAAKRQLIDTGTNKLYVRRNERGTSFVEVVDVSRSLSADRRRKAKTVSKPGHGDKGDRAR